MHAHYHHLYYTRLICKFTVLFIYKETYIRKKTEMETGKEGIETSILQYTVLLAHMKKCINQ